MLNSTPTSGLSVGTSTSTCRNGEPHVPDPPSPVAVPTDELPYERALVGLQARIDANKGRARPAIAPAAAPAATNFGAEDFSLEQINSRMAVMMAQKARLEAAAAGRAATAEAAARLADGEAAVMAAADEEVEEIFSPLRYRAEATAIIDEVFSPIDPSPHTKARGAAARRAKRGGRTCASPAAAAAVQPEGDPRARRLRRRLE